MYSESVLISNWTCWYHRSIIDLELHCVDFVNASFFGRVNIQNVFPWLILFLETGLVFHFHYTNACPNVYTLWYTFSLTHLLSNVYFSSNRSWDTGGRLSCIMYVGFIAGKKMGRSTHVATKISARSNNDERNGLRRDVLPGTLWELLY